MRGIYRTEFIGDDGVWGVRDDHHNVIVAWFTSQEMADAYCNLKYVYDWYKHLDAILMDSGFDDGSIQRPIHRECWKAIKNAVGDVE